MKGSVHGLSAYRSHNFNNVSVIVSSRNFLTIDRKDVHTKGQDQRSQFKVREVKTKFALIWAFPDRNPSLNLQMAMKWCKTLEVTWNRCSLIFQGHPSVFKFARDKKSPISTELSVSGLYLQFECTNGFEMMNTVWSSIEVVPYCIAYNLSVKFKGHTWWKTDDLALIWLFPGGNLIRIHGLL